MSELNQGAPAPRRRHRLSHQKEAILKRGEELGSLRLAAQEAGVGVGTAYGWQRRYRKEGYFGLLPRPRRRRAAATPTTSEARP